MSVNRKKDNDLKGDFSFSYFFEETAEFYLNLYI